MQFLGYSIFCGQLVYAISRIQYVLWANGLEDTNDSSIRPVKKSAGHEKL